MYPLNPPSSSMTITATMAIFHHLACSACSDIPGRSQQKLDIALGPGDRAGGHADDGPTLRFDPRLRLRHHPRVDSGIAYDTALSDLLSARLELRLDQRHELRAPLRKLERRIEDLGEADEARVAHDDVD